MTDTAATRTAFTPLLLQAHEQRDAAALATVASSAGLPRVVRWLRATALPSGTAIVATLVQQRPEWRRALVRAGAIDFLVASLPQTTEEDAVIATATQHPTRQKQLHEDHLIAVDTLRLLSCVSSGRETAMVDAVAAAYERGMCETRRAVLVLLSELSAKPQRKTMMRDARVVALCVDTLTRADQKGSWQLALAIVWNLNTPSSPVPEASDDEEIDADADADADADEEEEKPSDRGAIVTNALQHDAEDVRALLTQRTQQLTAGDTPSALALKLKKIHRVVSKHKNVRRAVGHVIPTLLQIQADGTESEQLCALGLANALIKRCPSNVLIVLRADGVPAVLRLFRTHSDVVSVVTQVERFVYRIHAVRCDKARAGTRLILTGLFGIAQDPVHDQAAVAIELLTLLSARHSLLPVLMDAGAIRVFCEALDQIRQRHACAGTIQLRHITTMVSRMATEQTNRKVLVEDGVLERLMAVLKRAPHGLRSDIAMALSTLATYSPAKHAIGSSGCLDVFEAMLCNSTESEQAAGADALASACLDCDANVARIRHGLVAQQCLELIDVKMTTTTCEPARRLLAILAVSPISHASVVADKMPSIALKMLRSSSLQTKRLGANLVEGLARDPAMWFEMKRLDIQHWLVLVSGDATVGTAGDAALCALSEYGLEHTRYRKEWVPRVSCTHGKKYYRNVLTNATHWNNEPPSTTNLTKVICRELPVAGDPLLIDHLRAAGGVSPLLRALQEANCNHGLFGEHILCLLHQSAVKSEETKRAMAGHLGVFSRFLLIGSEAERDAAAHAIVTIFEPSKWTDDANTRVAVVDTFLRAFATEASSSTAVHNAMNLISSLHGLDTHEADVTRAAFIRGLLAFANSNTTSRAALAVRLLLPWCRSVELAPALVGAGVEVICASLLEQVVRVVASAELATATAPPLSGAFDLMGALEMARALVTAGVSEKLIEEGAIDSLVSLFEALHCTPLREQVGKLTATNDYGDLAIVSLSPGAPFGGATGAWLWEFFDRVSGLLYQLARRYPHTRPMIGASACMPMLVAAMETRQDSSIETPRHQYVGLLAAVCLDCPENVRRVPPLTAMEACIDMLVNLRNAESALRLIYSITRDEIAGTEVSTNTALVDAVMGVLQKTSHEYQHQSTHSMATQAVGILLRYTPSRTRLLNAGVEDVLKRTTLGGTVHTGRKRALRLLHLEQRKDRQIAKANEHDGFYMVDEDDLDVSGMNHALLKLIAAIDDARSDQARVTAVQAIHAFINGSGERAVAAISAGYVDAMLRLYTTAIESDKTAKSTIQKSLRELHNVDQPSTVTENAEAQLVRGLFAFAASHESERAKLAVRLLTKWVANGVFCQVFEVLGIAASCVEWVRRSRSLLDSEAVGDGKSLKLADVELLLAWMTSSSQCAREIVIDHDLIPILVSQLPERPRGTRGNLLSILTDVAFYHATARPQFATHFETLTMIVHRGTSHERERAMRVIASACTDCPQNISCLVHDELLDVAVTMLDRGLSSAQSAALQLIESFCRDTVASPKVASRLSLVHLVRKRLTRTPPSTQTDAAKVIAELAKHETSRSQLIAVGVEQQLHTMTDDSVRSHAEVALAALRIYIGT